MAMPTESANKTVFPILEERVPVPRSSEPFVVEANYYEKLHGEKVKCTLCPRLCIISAGQRGNCAVRENRDGSLFSLVHSRVVAAQIDPIEKKPFFHFLPGSRSFSVATAGCNVHCSYCQNSEISQRRPEELTAERMSPKEIALMAEQLGARTVAYTYGEPTVFAEFVHETSLAVRERGLRNLVVTNGYMQLDAMRHAYSAIDAVKIDLKAFTERFYREVVGAHLQPVLNTLVALRAMNVWIELVYLLIPTLNDSEAELRAMAQWVRENLGAGTPLHFSRFHPDYHLTYLPTTSIESLYRAREIAQTEGLQFVYIGNVPGDPAQHTYCPKCSAVAVERIGFSTQRIQIRNGACEQCGDPLAGVWQE